MFEQKIINRYGEADLAVFKALIEEKLVKTKQQLASLEEQLAATADSKDNEGDWMDDSSNNMDIEMLEVMANRQIKHLLDLQNALQRVHNKSYGLCILTGELIDKRRLLAVPTTTKSLAAKVEAGRPAKKPSTPENKPKASKAPKIISRIIRKSDPTPKITNWEDDDDLDVEEDIDMDLDSDMELDLDNFSEEDLD